MSDPGKGQPVDELDSVCKAYKDCIKCAKKTHGEMCLPEFVEYKFRITKSDEIICRDDKGSCGRDLCMCDKMFAQSKILDSIQGSFSKQFQSTHLSRTSLTNNSTCSGHQMAGNLLNNASEKETSTPILSAVEAQQRRSFSSMETEKNAARMVQSP